ESSPGPRSWEVEWHDSSAGGTAEVVLSRPLGAATPWLRPCLPRAHPATGRPDQRLRLAAQELLLQPVLPGVGRGRPLAPRSRFGEPPRRLRPAPEPLVSHRQEEIVRGQSAAGIRGDSLVQAPGRFLEATDAVEDGAQRVEIRVTLRLGGDRLLTQADGKVE